MSVSDSMSDAIDMTKFLIARESRGNGDTRNAMRRIAARHGVSFSTLWRLRYRPPNDLYLSVFEALRAAYLAELERQERALRHERELTIAKGRLSASLVQAADIGAGAALRRRRALGEE